ncbi:MAG: biotin/lipoyl-containing protein, partial [Bacteroidales bacterium]|nr:biotin/lipoyl-containing protein [Bacteroidales bacterium]
MIEVIVPSPGESINSVTIANWLVSNGEYIEKEQEIVEIDSDKATLSIVAEESGTISIDVEAG